MRHMRMNCDDINARFAKRLERTLQFILSHREISIRQTDATRLVCLELLPSAKNCSRRVHSTNVVAPLLRNHGIIQRVSVALRKAGMATDALNRKQTVHFGGGRG